MVIIGLLAGIVAPQYFAQIGKSNTKVARAQIESFGQALDQYRLDVGQYPSTEQGLADAARGAAAGAALAGPHLKRDIPEDPWGHAYLYRRPGQHGDYDLVSLAPTASPAATARTPTWSRGEAMLKLDVLPSFPRRRRPAASRATAPRIDEGAVRPRLSLMLRSGSAWSRRCARSASRATAPPRCARCWAHLRASTARSLSRAMQADGPNAAAVGLALRPAAHRRPGDRTAARRRTLRACWRFRCAAGVGRVYLAAAGRVAAWWCCSCSSTWCRCFAAGAGRQPCRTCRRLLLMLIGRKIYRCGRRLARSGRVDSCSAWPARCGWCRAPASGRNCLALQQPGWAGGALVPVCHRRTPAARSG